MTINIFIWVKELVIIAVIMLYGYWNGDPAYNHIYTHKYTGKCNSHNWKTEFDQFSFQFWYCIAFLHEKKGETVKYIEL